jgi:hypothetical protein
VAPPPPESLHAKIDCFDGIVKLACGRELKLVTGACDGHKVSDPCLEMTVESWSGVRTLFMFNRHSVNIVKTGENVPKFYNLCSIPIFTLFSRNKNMFKLMVELVM